MPNRIFVKNERCIGCSACAKVCPVTCIDMVTRPAEDKAKGVKWPKLAVIDEPRCIFCNACVEVCDKLGEKAGKPDIFHAIVMEKETVVSTGPAIDSRECLGAIVSNGRIFYTSQASGFVVSQTYGSESKRLPAVWERP